MNKLKIISIVVFVSILAVSSLLFVPRKYDVAAFEPRKNVQYWELKTGSRIGFTKIAGVSLEKKNPIIYLHGGPGGCIRTEIIEALKPLSNLGHDVYFYDQIGSGHSERLAAITEYSVERHQKDLREIISIIGAKKVILVGHSWGTLLAINYLQDFEATVERIILSGTGPILPINNRLANEIAPDSLSLIAPEYSNKEGNKKAQNWRSKFMTQWAYLFHSKLASDKEADDFFTYLNQELSKSTACSIKKETKKYSGGSGYYTHIMTVKSFQNVVDKRDKLKTLKTPILIIRGQCDNQKWGFTKEYLDLFSNSKLEIIEGVGHDIISGNRSKYIELLRDFLEK